MISHSNCYSLMDWEPAESYDMDVDETQASFSFADCDVDMAPPDPLSVQDIYITSPILTSQLPSISEIALFLPPLETKTKPIVFPPFNIHAFSRHAPEPLIGPQVEPPTLASASCQGDNYTPAVHNFPPNSVYRPVTPSPSRYRTTLGDFSPIFVPVKPIDILDKEGQIADTRAATPNPFIENTSSDGWPNGIADPGDITPNLDCIPWPDSIDEQDVTPRTPYLIAETNTPEWIDEQDVTPNTPPPVVAETNTPEWTVDEDVMPLSPILEIATPFHWPEITFPQEFFDLGVDLIDLWSPNFGSSNFDEDDSVLRAFGVSSVEDLDWVLEGFHATNVADACIGCKGASNNFEAMFIPPLHNFSRVSPYDWAVSEAGPELISFDSVYSLHHNIPSDSFKLPSESGDIESNGLFQTSTPAPYNRSASPDVQSRSPLVIFNKAAYIVERDTPKSTKTDASTQTEKLPGATYGMFF